MPRDRLRFEPVVVWRTGGKMRVKIEIEMELPDECTNEEIQEWAEYVTGNRGGMKCENPLCDQELEAENVTVY